MSDSPSITHFKQLLQEAIKTAFSEDDRTPLIVLFLGDDEGIGMSSNTTRENTVAAVVGYISESTGGAFIFPVVTADPGPVAEAEAILAGTPAITHGVAPGFTEAAPVEDYNPPAPEPDQLEHERWSDDGNPHHGE